MLKRKVLDLLLDWKNSKSKKCLIVQGARQVGKTFAIEFFAKNTYKEYVEINFKETPSFSSIFANDLNVDTMLMGLKFRFPEKKFVPGETLIFFDEIQECAEAITSLKFWAIDNHFDVIASGSLLGIDYKRASSYPVGYVDYIHMYGLDFEEFLWAKGIGCSLILELKNCFDNRIIVPDAVNTQMMSLLREYLAVGGMPEIVDKYIETSNFVLVDKMQRQLLKDYQYDIAHYASAEEKVKAEKCYLSLSKQLLDKENHKFQYKEVEQNGKAQKFYSSIQWLLSADLISLCRNVSDIRYDLDDYSRSDMFRAYTTDLSLLMAMKDSGLKQHIIENTVSANTKGGLYECLIADFLIKKNLSSFYYRNDSTKKEIDFIIQKDGQVVPIEVKSSNSKATSLKWLVNNNDEIHVAYKFIDGNIGISDEGILTMPLYMAMFL